MNQAMTSGNGNATVNKQYDHSIKSLPISERLQLAARILNDIPPQAVVDYDTEWTEEDQRDVTAYSLLRSPASFSEEEDDA